MTWLIIDITAALMLMAYVLFKNHRAKMSIETEEQIAIKLLAKARMMFPTETDIVALDCLYQFTFRQMLLAMKTHENNYADLKRDSIILFNAKNRAIIDSVRFEEKYIIPLIKNQSIPISN
jgi:hypothetical protein